MTVNVLCHVHRYPNDRNAGAEVMVHAMMRDLAARGHRVQVLTGGSPAKRVVDGIPVVHIRNQNSHEARQVARLYDWADVAVTHLDQTRTAVGFARRARTPLVHVVHNDEQLGFWHVTPASCALAVWNSQWIARAHSRWAGPSVVCRPHVPAAEYATATGDRVTLINLMEAKGGPLLFRLAKLLPDVAFLGVKGGYGNQEIPSRLPDNVEVIDNTPDVVAAVYARTRVLLVPSSYESWGRVAVEAACSGIPVVAHPTPGLLESLGDAGVFVDRRHPADWAAAVRRLVVDADAWAAASAACRARAATLEAVTAADLGRFADAVAALGERRGLPALVASVPDTGVFT